MSNGEASFAVIGLNLYKDAKSALAELPPLERWFHIFWLLGPFILLIERTPADFWLSVLGFSFLVRSVVRRDAECLEHFWVRASLVFLGVALFTAALSSLPLMALWEAFVWMRFPLFAMAVVFWLGKDRRLLHAMLVLIGVGLVAMCLILTAELLVVGQQHGRLSWPYGDLVPGGYLAKVGLPAFVIMVALALSVRPRLAIFLGGVALITMVFSVFTGERIHLLIRACSAFLAGLVWRPISPRFIIILGAGVLLVAGIFYLLPDIGARYIEKTFHQLPFHSESLYYRTIKPGVVAFWESPWVGIGAGNFRYLCSEIIGALPLECRIHPHNFYIQLLAETGLIGFITGVVMLWSIIISCFIKGWRSGDVLRATAFIVPLAVFWPVATTGNFFSQWDSSFIWSGVSVAIAMSYIEPRKS